MDVLQKELTYWDQVKMAAILQTIFTNAFSMQIFFEILI